VDPLYLLLPYFQNEEKWQPWTQIAQAKNIPSEIMTVIKPDQLKHFFLINDSYGDDMILYKFKKEKVLEWLTKKKKRVQAFLTNQFMANKTKELKLSNDFQNSDGGAFSASFHLPDQDSIVTPSKVDGIEPRLEPGSSSMTNNGLKSNSSDGEYIHRSASQIICEYLPDDWQRDFLNECGLTTNDLSKKKKNADAMKGTVTSFQNEESSVDVVTPPSSSKRIAAITSDSGMSEADKLMQYTMGNLDNGNEEKNSKKRKDAPKSMGLKRLSKVNTKGMKSMTSFFSVNKKAKKKS